MSSFDSKKIIEDNVIPDFELDQIIYYPEKIADRIIVSGSYKGKRALLKLIDNQNPRLTEKLNRELLTQQAIASIFDERTAANFPALYDVHKGEEYSYLVRSFFEGKPLAEYKTDENTPTIISYSSLSADPTINYESAISRTANILLAMNSFDQASADKFAKMLQRRFEMDILKLDLEKIAAEYQIDLQNHRALRDQIFAEGLDCRGLCPVIGDLVPANIILDDNGGLKIIDIEWFSIDHKMIDVGLLWLTLYGYPQLQEILAQSFIGDEQSELLFRYSIIRIICGYKWYSWLHQHNHIWSRYFRAAGESFEALIKVK